MTTRREFLGALSWPAAAEPGALARDESFWFEVQQAFSTDRSMINLNNAGVSPSPAVVLDAMKRHLDFANGAPAYRMWQIQEPQKETARAGLARLFGCDSEEVAITRNVVAGNTIWVAGQVVAVRRGGVEP